MDFKILYQKFLEHTILVYNNISTLQFQNYNRIFYVVFLLILLLFFLRKTFFKFNDLEQKRLYHKKYFKKRIVMFFLYSILFLLILLSFSNPYINYVEKKVSQPKTVLFVDDSLSMNNYNTSFINSFKSFLKENNVSYDIVYFKNSYSEIIPYIKENTPITIISDDNVKDALKLKSYVSASNSSVLFLNLKPKIVDCNVKILSQNSAYKNNILDVNVVVNGNSLCDNKNYTLKIFYNNKTILEKNFNGKVNYSFKIKAKNVGENFLYAKIILDDYYKNNNEFKKYFYVYNPPKILLFSSHSNSPLKKYLSSTYNLKEINSLNNIDSFKEKTLIIDDIPYKNLKDYVLKLSDYVVNGNSIIFFGGKNSFDYDFYENSLLEKFLPVKIGSSNKKSSDQLNVVFLIDISGSTGQSFSNNTENTIQDVEKNLVVSAYDSLKEKDRVTVIAFNNEPYIVAPMNVKSQQLEVKDRILKLKFFGGTSIKPALYEAVKQLSRVEGKKYIVLFSDGYSYTENEDLNFVLGLKKAGIKLYTVSVGENSNVNFLRQLSKITNAKYFKPEEKSKFNILFENSKSKNNNVSNALFLTVWDDDHFITENLYLNSYVESFNQIFPKDNGRVLIVTTKNNPILTTSYFGLGKILVFSSDNGLYWSKNVFEKNSDLFSRMVNYALGSSKENNSIVLQSDFSGENNIYFYNNVINNNVIVDKIPLYKVENDNLKLYSYITPIQLDNDYFVVKTVLNEGKYSFLNKTFYINYNKEYDYFNGLKQYLNENNIIEYDDYEKILKSIKENSFYNKKVYENINNYFLLLAALWYFLIIFIRKTFYKE